MDDYDPSGQEYERVVAYRDGGTSTNFYDLSNGLVGQENYQAASGASSTTDYDTRGVQDWFTVTKLYNSAGQQTQQTVSNRTNSTTVVDLDVNNGQASTVSYYAGGNTVVYNYNTEGNQPWSSTSQFYNASNQETQQTVYNNDGSITTQIFQLGTSNVSELDYFGTDGLEQVYDYNVTGTQPWSQVQGLYNSSGTELQQTVYNNDGSTTLIYFDPQNGAVSNVNFTAANGLREVYQYDTENQQPWSSVDQAFNASGQLGEQDVFNDDGSETQQFFSAGQVTSQNYYGTDGSSVVTTNDVAGTQPWSSVQQGFDSNGQETYETVNLDGGGYDYFAYADGNPTEEDMHSASGSDTYAPVGDANMPPLGSDTPGPAPAAVDETPAEPYNDPAVPDVTAPPDSGPSGEDPLSSSPDPFPSYDDGSYDGGGFGSDPIVLNLRHGAVSTTPEAASQAYFDLAGNGSRTQTGWVTAGEGFLVSDPADAPITSVKQLIASLADLAAYDSNKDGVINAADSDFAKLGVWVPSTSGNNGSLISLGALGISAISLAATQVNQADNGNVITSTFVTSYADGTKGQGAAVDLQASSTPSTGSRTNLAPVVLATAPSPQPPEGTTLLPVQPPPPLPARQDTLALHVSEDAWQGDAQFTIQVDGKTIGGPQTASASHADGQSQAYVVQGSFEAGPHQVGVTFTNSTSGGSPGAEKVLYLDGVTFDGKTFLNADAALQSDGSQSVQVDAAAAGLAARTYQTAGPDIVLSLH